MNHVILDSSVLISHWRRSRRRSLVDCTAADAVTWAQRLIDLELTDAIVTPVYLEIAGGVVTSHELELTRSYLARFRCIDEGRILNEDWTEARRLAERIPRGPSPRPRGAVDCLIKAIAKRLNYDVRSFDTGMPR